MSEPNVRIDFKLRDTGWADCDLHIGNKFGRLEGISDTTDAIGDLARIGLMIAAGAWTARVSFDREPTEWRLIAGPVWEDPTWRKGFWVRVLEFPDIYARQPDEKGDFVFEAECGAKEFAMAVLEAIKRLIPPNGVSAYSWGLQAFPLRAMKALEAALAVEDPPMPIRDLTGPGWTIFSPRKDT